MTNRLDTVRFGFNGEPFSVWAVEGRPVLSWICSVRIAWQQSTEKEDLLQGHLSLAAERDPAAAGEAGEWQNETVRQRPTGAVQGRH